MANPPEQLFDRRTVERFIRRGLIDQPAYDRWLSELPDVSHNVAVVDFDGGEDAPKPDGEG
jgi:hypothetical protein